MSNIMSDHKDNDEANLIQTNNNIGADNTDSVDQQISTTDSNGLHALANGSSDDIKISVLATINQLVAKIVEQDNNKSPKDNRKAKKKPTCRAKRELSQLVADPENSQSTEGGRSKRQRTQTKLFQVVDSTSISHQSHLNKSNLGQLDDETQEYSSSSMNSTPNNPTKRSRKSSTNSNSASTNSKRRKSSLTSSSAATGQGAHTESSSPASATLDTNPHLQRLNETQFIQDVIHYEKNDYLAIRNEENTFYLCQLTETVRSARPTMRVRWFDTRDEGKTYFLTSQYDKVPQKSVIMPVDLTRLKSETKGEQLYSLEDDAKETVLDRLKRSLIVTNEDHMT